MKGYYKLGESAWMRDSEGNLYTGEQLLVALLMKAKGKKRGSEEEVLVQKLMQDINLD